MSSGDPKCLLCAAQANEQWADLPDIKAHAEDGCPYCAAMLQGLLYLIPDIEARFGYDASFRFRSRREMMVFADPNGSLGYPNNSKAVNLFYRWYTADEEDQQPYQPPGDTSSEDSFAQAQEWIRACLDKHALCGNDELFPLPSRVLDLGDAAEGEPIVVQLLESTGRSERYIALSHSWGGERPLITTTETLEEHKTGIQFDCLPLTFQDAARIARRLGIRYLWIDSLCIIQDSPEDWQLEASRMASVYRNSWLTVSAIASSSPSSGCFRRDLATIAQAPDDDDDPLSVLFPEASKLRKDLRLSLRFATAHPDFSPFFDPEKDVAFPLLGRAWAYQERLLAPRVLHFGPHELFWECMQDLDCECGEMKWKANKHMGSYANRSTVNELPPKISHYAALHIGTGKSSSVSGEKRKQKLLSRWKEMVDEYNKRLLTYPTDRLPAFSGVAAEMVDALGMKYCAGLWEETLPIGLLWERGQSKRWLKLGDARPAPSWSWASVDAPVRFLLDLIGPYPAYAVPVINCEVLEACCIPSGSDERGQLVYGESYIVMSLEMLRASLCFAPDPHDTPYVPWKFIRDSISDGSKGPPRERQTKGCYSVKVGKKDPVTCVLDVAPCDGNGDWVWDGKDPIYCGRILERDGCCYWLVLRKVEGEATYERIGIVQHPYADWETKGGKQKIRII
ncbi:heterokaryon incompatibility protein-domain-containing protein [Podospora aff. communis PSN243]|uniref:Heterokaryon incompatibility protein-domain-containing protein n=1 Tax=Podospora aff. communis PSN243 TaxID=3040156 RepID=A0AAV9G6M1_9PEZI|nr:heterokaryon incompatibility protein-domain-containing protein [Podospora aff. communis PSN243]